MVERGESGGAGRATEQELLAIEHPAERGRVLRVRVERPVGAAGALPHVLVAHGFKGFMHWGFFPLVSQRIASAGFVAISWNHTGSGIGEDLERFGDAEGFAAGTLSRELEDFDRARELARSGRIAGVDASRAGVLGHSRGGGTAIVHAAEHADYGAVVTWAAVDDFDRFDAETKRAWREQGFLPIHNARTGQVLALGVAALDDLEANRTRLDPIAAASRLATPALFVHGTADESVPVEASRRLHEACARSRLVLVEGAGHTFGAVHPLAGVPPALEQVLDATVRFLAEHV